MAYATDNFQSWQRALRDNHQALRSGLIVDNILPDFRPFLTDIEYSRVNDKTGNVQQVDELVRILLTKEHKHFESFCRVCERNGYQGWAKRLRASADGRQVPEGTYAWDKTILYDQYLFSFLSRGIGAIIECHLRHLQ